MTISWQTKTAWQSERTLIVCSQCAANVTLTSSPYVFTFVPDANNRVTIDLTELVRLTAIGSSRTISLNDGTGAQSATFSVGGRINPATLIVPINHAVEYMRANYDAPYIVAPSVILEGSENVEFAVDPDALTTLNIAGGTYSDNIISLTSGANKLVIDDDGELLQSIFFKKLDCAKQYCRVSWTSASGHRKIHVMQALDFTNNVGETIDLLTDDINYHELRGRADSFSLQLDDLSAYDVFYYSDILTSSEVLVSFDYGDWERVIINEKKIAIPNSNVGALNQFKVKVNWRRYDSF